MDAEQYVPYFAEALQRVPQSFFRVATTYEPAGIVRERVFCYELYHQLRLILPDDGAGAYLHGEIDKRGHMLFDRKDRRNPDFIIHTPGVMDGNKLVVEIKGRLDYYGIRKDIETLLRFVNNYQYGCGLFILYNHTLADLQARMQLDFRAAFAEEDQKHQILLMCIERARARVEVDSLDSFLQR